MKQASDSHLCSGITSETHIIASSLSCGDFLFSKKVISFNLYLSLDCFIEIYWVGEVLFDRNTRLDGTLGEEDWKKGERCFLFWNPIAISYRQSFPNTSSKVKTDWDREKHIPFRNVPMLLNTVIPFLSQ